MQVLDMLIDTHAHLEMREFKDYREDVIKRAREAGVEYIVTIGTTVESSRDRAESKATRAAARSPSSW
jgi:TatD DNase family protein